MGPPPPPRLKIGYYAYHRYISGNLYDFVSTLISVNIRTNRLPRLPRIRSETTPPPFKTAYYAYHRYFSGKMYDIVSITVSVFTLTNRLLRLPCNIFEPPSPLKTAYYAYHMYDFVSTLVSESILNNRLARLLRIHIDPVPPPPEVRVQR